MPKACRYCNKFFSFAEHARRHEYHCKMRDLPLSKIQHINPPPTDADAAVQEVFNVAEDLLDLPRGLLSGNRQSVRPDHHEPVDREERAKVEAINLGDASAVQCPHCNQYFTSDGIRDHERHCKTRCTMTSGTPSGVTNHMPESTSQSYSVELKQVAWTACYQTSQGVQVCGGFDTVAFDVGKGFTKQGWLTLEASLRNQPGNSHLFNFRLVAAQILDQ